MLTRHAGVLGRPITHSLSPLLHRTAYATLGLTDWDYSAHDVGADELAGFIAALDSSWVGLSLTMPLKEEALRIAGTCSVVARQTGAVNTLLRRGETWHGDNTDVGGVVGALAPTLGTRVDHAVIIGSGATARSVLAALASLGIGSIDFVVRAQARESTLRQARDHGVATRVLSYDDGPRALQHAPLVVSTVPAGGADAIVLPLVGRKLPAEAVWLDVVYADWPTAMGRVGAALGARVIPGVDMLVHQAAEQVRLMTGQSPDVAAMSAAGRAALGLSDA